MLPRPTMSEWPPEMNAISTGLLWAVDPMAKAGVSSLHSKGTYV